MKIRKATQKDIPAISGLIREMAKYHNKLDKFYATSISKKALKSYIGEFLRDRNRVAIVAEENKKMVGYILGSIRIYPVYISRTKSGCLDEAFVDMNYRNKGIGKKLLSELVKWFKSKKIRDVVASVDARNETSIKIWKKLGFHTHAYTNKVEIGLNL
jgi:L-amino acid N-acyltransferase YncA